MSFLAILSPLLAVGTLMYLLKAIGLGNLMKPANALAMATGGAGKIMGTPDLGNKMQRGLAKTNPNKLADNMGRTMRSDTRKGQLMRAGARSAARTGRTGKNVAAGVKDYKNMSDEERQAKRAELASKLDPRNLKGLAPTSANMRGQMAAATGLLASMGIFLAGSNSELGRQLKPLAFTKDRHALEATKRENDRSLKAELKGRRGEEARTRVAVEHFHALARSAGAANRGLDVAAGARGGTFLPLDAGEQKARAAQSSRVLGGANPTDLFVDPFTGTVLTGVQATKIPNMGNPTATLAAARQQHHYFDDEFKKVRAGESEDEWARRMTLAMVVKGGVDPNTGELVDMLEKFGIRDNAEGRKLVLEAADVTKEVPAQLDREIKISAAEHAAINTLISKHQVIEDRTQFARAVKSQQAFAENVTPGLTNLNVDNQLALAQLDALRAQSNPRELASALSSFIDGPLGQLAANVQGLTVMMQGVKAFNNNDSSAALEKRLIELNQRQGDVLGGVVAALADAQASTGAEQSEKFGALLHNLHKEFTSQEWAMNDMASNIGSALESHVKQHELIVHKAADRAPSRGQDLSSATTRPPAIEA